MLNKLSLKVKLGAGFGLLLVTLLILGGASYRAIIRLDERAEEVDRKTSEMDFAASLEISTMKESSGIRGYLLTGDEKMLEGYEQGKSGIKETMGKLAPLVHSEEGKREYGEIERTSDAYSAVGDREIQLRREGKTKEAIELMSTQTLPAFAEAAKTISIFVDHLTKGKAELDKKQHADVAQGKTLILSLALAGIALGLVVAILLTRSITGAVGRMLSMIQEVAAHNLTVKDLEISSQDEIGRAGVALNGMKNSLHEMIQSISSSAMQVASASEELNVTSQQITANSEETSAQAEVVTKAAQAVSQNLQTVATGAEEMGTSIKEIAKNATEAAKVATSAVKVAETANAAVSKLGDSSSEIGQVIKVITSIAQQTNLLALNATIEAARAGEAGKGFAVVANEVKELAKETAKATEDISRKIEAIQTDTKAAIEAIGTISEVINQINGISSTIATAVEEQNATTNEMSRNVSDAARGSGEITSNITGVAGAAQGTTRGATDTQKASQQLVETSTKLRRLVEQFKVGASENARGNNADASQTQSKAAHAGA
jgi:methyl-accepting chemotaxis protein